MRMLVVYYMKCVIDEDITIRVTYDEGGLIYDDDGSILHEVCISGGL